MRTNDPDRPALEEEIEVTPEMIEAGALVLGDYDCAEDRPRDWVPIIYREMERARFLRGCAKVSRKNGKE